MITVVHLYQGGCSRPHACPSCPEALNLAGQADVVFADVRQLRCFDNWPQIEEASALLSSAGCDLFGPLLLWLASVL